MPALYVDVNRNHSWIGRLMKGKKISSDNEKITPWQYPPAHGGTVLRGLHSPVVILQVYSCGTLP